MKKPFHAKAKSSLFKNARALKKRSTSAEDALWEALRDKKFKGYKFRRQHPIDIFILDFYCHELKLAIEVDGSIHDELDNKEYDAGRTTELEELGVRVIRFRNEEVLQNLWNVLKAIEKNLTPNPSPDGRGELSATLVREFNEQYHVTNPQISGTPQTPPSPTGRGTDLRLAGGQGEVKPGDYVIVEFQTTSPEQKELLSALLPEYGSEGTEELDSSLKCYVPQSQFSPKSLKEFLKKYALKIPFTHQSLPNKNWNEAWEKSYEPIVVSDKVIIRASFHGKQKRYPFQILVDPQMSFGTGHHETTQLMIEMMLGMDFKEKSVLDFGSGTGVLSILAHKMRAKRVLAIDIDEWAYNNIRENIKKNRAKTIVPMLGGGADLPAGRYGIVLANVNKNILLENMEILLSGLIKKGVILFSGLLLQDEDAMLRSAGENGLILLEKKTKNEWLCLKFMKR